MILGELIDVLYCMDIKIMQLGKSGEPAPIYEGKSSYFRMNDYEANLSVMWVAPHRYLCGGLFIMVEEPQKSTINTENIPPEQEEVNYDVT